MIRAARRGFTLLELLIVVVILGILAGIALPNYARFTQRRYRELAKQTLLAIYSGERAYFFAHGQYYTVDAASPDWETIGVSVAVGSAPLAFTADGSSSTLMATVTSTATTEMMFIQEDGVLHVDGWPVP